MLVVPQVGLLVLADRLRQYLGSLSPRVALYQNDLVPGPLTVRSDFLAATFPGYTGPQAVFFSAPAVLNDDGLGEIVASEVLFACAGGGLPQRIYGYWIEDASGTNLLWAQRFDTRLTMFLFTDRVQFNPVLTVGSAY